MRGGYQGLIRPQSAASEDIADQANLRLSAAHDAARTLLGIDGLMLPAEVDAAGPAVDEVAARLRAALAVWQALLPEPTPQQLAAHIRSTYPPLRQAYASVQAAALAWLRQRHLPIS